MINNRFLGKGGIVDYQTSNTAYDKLAFIADNYPDMVKMYDTIMAHLKLPSGGGGCNYLKHTYSGIPLIIKLGDVTGYGYDTSKPDDIEIIRNSLSVNRDGFTISKPMYAEEFKYTAIQTVTPRSKYLLNLFTENKYISLLDKYGDFSGDSRMYAYGYSTQVSRIENGVVYDTENNPIDYSYNSSWYPISGAINEVADKLDYNLPDTVKCLVLTNLAKTEIRSGNTNYIVGYSDTLYSDYNSTATSVTETIPKEVTLNNVFIFPYSNGSSYMSSSYSDIRLFSKDRTNVDSVRSSGNSNLISIVFNSKSEPFLRCSHLLNYKYGLAYKIQDTDYRCDITDNYSTDTVMRYS